MAFSGGIDSKVLLHHLTEKRKDITLVTVDHLDKFAEEEIAFCEQIADKYNIPYIVKKIKPYDGTTSKESFWSRQRNTIFQQLDHVVVTGHHLGDEVEWYIMTAMQGNARPIRYSSGNVCRPFILLPKKNIIEYANFHKLTYITDPSNSDIDYCLRNKVRHKLLPNVYDIFPGIEKVVRKAILKHEKEDQ